MFILGDHEPWGCIFNVSRHILPSLSIFGWYIGVINLTLGGSKGYLSGILIDNVYVPSANGDSAGPCICA